MSRDSGLFQRPTTELYYQVPAGPDAERPKPLFPWEQSAKKPTRIFADERRPPSSTQSSEESIANDGSDPETQRPYVLTPGSFASTASLSALESFSRTNLWDNVTSIDEYVRAMKQSQAKKGKVQVLPNFDEKNFVSNSPAVGKRRESMILTDFPTDVERPSLPVTPAPRRPPTFWGGERDEEGNLPAAEGVPDQADWVCVRFPEVNIAAALARL